MAMPEQYNSLWDRQKSVAYWDNYYAKRECPETPSLFAEFCQNQLTRPCKILDLGCGNGRDSKFFAQNGNLVIACDQSSSALGKLDNLENIEPLQSDFYDLDFNLPEKVDLVYSRFSLHAVDFETQHRALEWCFSHLNGGGKIFLEMRSIDDPLYGQGAMLDENAFVTDHYRRFENLESLNKELVSIGFSIDYSVCKKGLAPHREEDPKIIRIVAGVN